MCVPHAVHMHYCLKILEASNFGHMLNMSSSEVTNGNGAMPAFGEKLGPDDIEAGMQVQRWCYGFWLPHAMIYKSSLCLLGCLAAFPACCGLDDRTWPTTSTTRLTSGERRAACQGAVVHSAFFRFAIDLTGGPCCHGSCGHENSLDFELFPYSP